MADEQKEKEKLVKVRVRVPDRSAQGFPAFYAAQRKWPNGDSEAILPESKAKELQQETSLLVVVSIEPTSETAERGPDPIQPGQVTSQQALPGATPSASDEDAKSPGKPLRR